MCGLAGALGTHGRAVPPAIRCVCAAAFSRIEVTMGVPRCQSEKLSAKDTGDVLNGCAGPAVSHGNATALLSQQSAPRQGLCLDPGCGQTPSHLAKEAPSRRNGICDCVFPSLHDEKKKKTQKIWLENWVPLTAGEGYEIMGCCACGFQRGLLRGVNVRLQASASQQVGWAAAAPFSRLFRGKPMMF